MLSPSRTYSHAITPQAVDLEANHMKAALALGGRPLRDGIDLTQVASQQLVEEVMSDLSEANVAVTRRVWGRTSDGGVQLVLEVEQEADVIHAGLALG